MKTKFPIEVKKSEIDGKGAFALGSIPSRKKIGELNGVVISVAEGRKLAGSNKRIALVELDYKYALNAFDTEGELKYINHCCTPNTYMRVFNHHVEFYSLRKIKKGEELTCNYGETHHDGKLRCNCGAKNCKGAL
jgi:SET domain-containing protein